MVAPWLGWPFPGRVVIEGYHFKQFTLLLKLRKVPMRYVFVTLTGKYLLKPLWTAQGILRTTSLVLCSMMNPYWIGLMSRWLLTNSWMCFNRRAWFQRIYFAAYTEKGSNTKIDASLNCGGYFKVLVIWILFGDPYWYGLVSGWLWISFDSSGEWF